MANIPILKTYSIQKAKALGYESITTPYSDSERDNEFLKRVLIDLDGIDHCLIETGQGIEVGRLKKELL